MQKDAEIWKKEFEGWYGGMKILHYFLGFPPYRTGGLTKYAFDLAKSQVTDGNEVLALWPGEIKSYSAQPYIKEGKRIEGIRNLELINPLPVSLDEGINQFEAFTKPCDVGIYVSFLEIEKPDVIHIHTLMGMHKEFIEATNQSKIRTVYTSHDYFGLCPKVTLYKYGECCDDDHCCRDCIQCNANSLSLKKIQILQSHIYRWAKDTSIVKMLRKKHRGEFFAEKEVLNMPGVDTEETSAAYRKLRAYYVWMYEHIDFIHFNSTVSESVFKRYLTPKDSKVVSITHKGILDNRDNPHVNSDKLMVTALGTVMLPRISYFYANGMMDEFNKAINKGLNFVKIVAVPLALFFVINTNSTILLISSEAYLDAKYAMQLIMPVVIFSGFSSLIGMQVFVAYGKEKIVMLSACIGAIVNVSLNALVIPQFYAAGAAFATSVSELVVLLIELYFGKKLLTRGVIKISFLKVAFASVLAGVVSIFTIDICAQLPFWNFLYNAVSFFGVYFLALILMRETLLTDYTQMILSMIKRKYPKSL